MLKPLLIAHRGDISSHSENTIAAFAYAFQKGADGIELDVHLDTQNQPIVVHNYLYDRSLTYPLLTDVCELFKNDGFLEIEIKSFDINCLREVRVILDHHNVKYFKLTSSVQPLLHHMRAMFPEADIGIIFRRWLLEPWMTDEFVTEWAVAHLKLSGANYFHLDLDQWTQNIADTLHARGYKLHSHLKTNSIDDYKKTVQLHLHTCTFDDISLLKLT